MARASFVAGPATQESHDGQGGGHVKKVEAVIKPFKVDAVKESPDRCRGDRPHLQRGEGVGRQKGHTEMYRGSEYQVDLVPKVESRAGGAGRAVSRG